MNEVGLATYFPIYIWMHSFRMRIPVDSSNLDWYFWHISTDFLCKQWLWHWNDKISYKLRLQDTHLPTISNLNFKHYRTRVDFHMPCDWFCFRELVNCCWKKQSNKAIEPYLIGLFPLEKFQKQIKQSRNVNLDNRLKEEFCVSKSPTSWRLFNEATKLKNVHKVFFKTIEYLGTENCGELMDAMDS